jgi:glycosyltransferase involved in cell wall biosynthesis
MKIGIDARALKVEGGSKVYAINLLKSLQNKKNILLFGIDKFNGFNCINTKVKNDSILRLFYENITLPRLIKKNHLVIFHGLKGVVPYFGKFKKVMTVHDIIPFIYPRQFRPKDFFYWKFIFPVYAKRADFIIVNSENTKKDLIKFLNIPKKKVKTILLAQDSAYKIIKKKSILEKVRKKYRLDNKFIFYSGSINPRKNLKRVIKSFQKTQDKIKLDLVITGITTWKSGEEMKMIKENPKIKLLGLIPKEDLVCLYNLAEVFIYPSLYEGFGLPILEAQACGCPVITSNISSMPEVAGQGAILINPYRIDEITEAIYKVTGSKKIREDLIQKGFKNIKRFSWEKAARETLAIYHDLQND